MIRCFLSHSSADKGKYIKVVADTLGKQSCVYDEYTFEESMPSLQQIIKGLCASQLFIAFLSDKSLNSGWVQTELLKAHDLLSSNQLLQIFPIIIDKNITYKDPRIPQWMRESYNLKLISRPTVAARRIMQRLREISWHLHPTLEKRQKIFVGRNAKIKEFEERIDDFDQPSPVCIIASGIDRIGRRSFLRHAFVKANLIDDSYRPPVITLGRRESLEDFIIKIHDLGLVSQHDLTNMLSCSPESKVELAVELLKEMRAAREVLFIVDDACLVTYQRNLVDWFRHILKLINTENQMTLAVASSYRPLKSEIKNEPWIFSIELPELTMSERRGLFKRYCEFENLLLSKEDLSFFSDLLYGYPEQVLFAVDIIKDSGVSGARKEALW